MKNQVFKIDQKGFVDQFTALAIQWIFTALHGMRTRSSDENSLRPSVKRMDCDKTEKKDLPDFYTTRKII